MSEAILPPSSRVAGLGGRRSDDAAIRYLDLLKLVLTRTLADDDLGPDGSLVRFRGRRVGRALIRVFGRRRLSWLTRFGARRMPTPRSNGAERASGRDWPVHAETMIGLERLDHLQHCVEDVIHDDVPGDLVETGVWRGGAAIFMRAVLAAYGDTERVVWAADSFQGLPPPKPEEYPEDDGDRHHRMPEMAVSIEEVRSNFQRYGLLDAQVQFLPGWFHETLPEAPIEQIAVLRLDGDMYESTIVALEALYPKVSPGGYVVIDDYGALPACAKAVDTFRREHHIEEPLERIDWSGVCWRKSR